MHLHVTCYHVLDITRFYLQSTSAACQESTTSRHLPTLPPPISATPTAHSTAQMQDSAHSHLMTPVTTTPTSNMTTSSVAKTTAHSHPSPAATNLRGSPLRPRSGTPTEISGGKVLKSRTAMYRTGSPVSSRGSRSTPSPPSSFTYRSSNSSGTGGSHRSSVRSSPYHSPRDSTSHSQGGSLRGSARNSPHQSPRNSIHGSPSPSPELLNHALASKLESIAAKSGSSGRNVGKSPKTSPKLARRGLLLKSNSDPGSPKALPSEGALPPAPRVPSPTLTTPLKYHHETARPSLSSTPPMPSNPLPPPPHSSHLSSAGSSQSSPRSVDFESGRVLTQLPYEYSSFLDVPPAALGESNEAILYEYCLLCRLVGCQESIHTQCIHLYVYVVCLAF